MTMKTLWLIILYFTTVLFSSTILASSSQNSTIGTDKTVTIEDVQKFDSVPEDKRPVSATNIKGATTIGTDEAKKMFDDHATFIDVRRLNDWDAGHIPGAHHLFLDKDFTEANIEKIASQKTIPLVIYCNGEKCWRSSAASSLAVKWGYSHVYYFRDGYPAWQKSGNPIE